MALRYYSQYKEAFYSKRTVRIEIHDSTYTAAAIELDMAIPPYIIKYDSTGETIESPIRGSEMQMVFWSSPGYLDDMFTSDAKRFQVKYFISGSLKWHGFVQPELFTEPYHSPDVPVTIRAIDGLGILKNIEYPASGNEKISLWTIFRNIIKKIDSTVATLYLYDSCYIFENNTNQNSNDTPFRELYIKEIALKENEDEYMSCYDVLEVLLKRFHCYIIFQDDGWHIQQINAMKGAYKKRKADIDTGTVVSISTIDSSKIITGPYYEKVEPNNFWLDGSQIRTILPGWRKFIIEQEYGRIDNMFDGTIRKITYGLNYVELSYAESGYINIPPVGIYYKEIGYVSVGSGQYFHIQISISNTDVNQIYHDIHVVCHTTAGNLIYLQDDGSWSEAFNNIVTLAADFKAGPLPANGIVSIYFVHYSGGSGFFSINLSGSSFSFQSTSGIALGETNTTNINYNNNKVEKIETIIGDIPNISNYDLIYDNGIYYSSNGINFSRTSTWSIFGMGDNATLNELIADEYSKNHKYPIVQLEGSMRATFDILDTPFDLDGVRYQILSSEINGLYSEFTIVLLQLGDEIEKYLQLEDENFLLLEDGGKIILE